MFRRRAPRRRQFPARPGRPTVPPVVQRALARAHRAMERGDTSEAARIFHRLGDEAASRGMDARASWLMLQAARAEALGGNGAGASDEAERALKLFAQGPPLPPRVAAAGERLVQTLRQGGYEAEAERIEGMLEETLRRAGTTRQEMAQRFAADRARHGRLPAKCPSCGGPLVPDEVEYRGPDTAVCPYCGSVIKTE